MKFANNEFPSSYDKDFETIFSNGRLIYQTFRNGLFILFIVAMIHSFVPQRVQGKTLPAEFAIDYFTSEGKR